MRQIKTKGVNLFFKLIAWLFIFSFSSLSFATEYTRGSLQCDNFEEMKAAYEAEPENIKWQSEYGYCLIVKGDVEGLTRLMTRLFLIDKRQLHIIAAYLIARYLHTDENFEHSTIDRVDEAIEAYLRVLALIDAEPPYPDYELNERYVEIELKTTFLVPELYFDKFSRGAQGIENYYILQSPDYKGDRELKTFPQYNRYTVDSLNKMIKFAGYCVNLPRKNHFDLTLYTAIKKACQVLKDTATALLPMEIKRLTFLENQTSCRDLSNCPEYDELADPIVSIVKQGVSDREAILRPFFRVIP